MILITKIHNPPSLLFWLRRAFSLRDIHQEKNEVQKQKGRGKITEEQGEENLPLVCSFQQNTLHTLVTNCHSTRKHFGNIFQWTAASLLTNLLQIPWVLQDSHGRRAAVSLGIPSLSLHGVFSIHLHLSSKLMAKFSSKDGGEPTQLSNFDVIFSSGTWMAVLCLLEFLAKGLEIASVVTTTRGPACLEGFISNSQTLCTTALLKLSFPSCLFQTALPEFLKAALNRCFPRLFAWELASLKISACESQTLPSEHPAQFHWQRRQPTYHALLLAGALRISQGCRSDWLESESAAVRANTVGQ